MTAEPIHAQGTAPGIGAVSDWALGTLGHKAREGLVATIACGGCALIGLAGPLTLLWFNHRLLALGWEFGWGNIPPHLLPFYPRTRDVIHGLATITTLGFLGAIVAFLVALNLFRSGVEAVVGKRAFRYPWRWTIGSLFIPFLNFYRPWIGFAELRRTSVALAEQPYRLERPAFDLPTLLLGLVFYASTTAIVVLAFRLGRVSAIRPFGMGEVASAQRLLAMIAIVRLVWAAALLGYLLSLWDLLQRARIAIVELDPFG